MSTMGEARTRLFQTPFHCHSIALYKAPPHQTDISPNCGATTALSMGLISLQFADLLTVKQKGMVMNHWQGFMERRGIVTDVNTSPGNSIPVMKDETTLSPDLMRFLRTSLFPQCATFVILQSREGGPGHFFTIFKGFRFRRDLEGKLDCKKDMSSNELFIFDAQRNRTLPEAEWPGFFQATGDAFRDHFGLPRVSVTNLALGGFMYREPKTNKQVIDEYINGPGSALLEKSRIARVDVRDPMIEEAISMDLDDDKEASTLAAARIVAPGEVVMAGRRSTRRSSLPRQRARRSSSARMRHYSRRRRA